MLTLELIEEETEQMENVHFAYMDHIVRGFRMHILEYFRCVERPDIEPHFKELCLQYVWPMSGEFHPLSGTFILRVPWTVVVYMIEGNIVLCYIIMLL